MASENKIIIMYLVMPGHIKNISMDYIKITGSYNINNYVTMAHIYGKIFSDTQNILFLYFYFILYSTCHCTRKNVIGLALTQTVFAM